MHRDDNSIFLLYIEPKKEEKLQNPIEDELTQLMEMALSKAKKGCADYSGNMSGNIEFRDKMMKNPENIEKYRKLVDSGFFGEDGGYMGFHTTECGERSTNCDYQLENGMITNSLAPFYLKWYRYSIPENDMIKIQKLKEFYNGR